MKGLLRVCKWCVFLMVVMELGGVLGRWRVGGKGVQVGGKGLRNGGKGG